MLIVSKAGLCSRVLLFFVSETFACYITIHLLAHIESDYYSIKYD